MAVVFVWPPHGRGDLLLLTPALLALHSSAPNDDLTVVCDYPEVLLGIPWLKQVNAWSELDHVWFHKIATHDRNVRHVSVQALWPQVGSGHVTIRLADQIHVSVSETKPIIGLMQAERDAALRIIHDFPAGQTICLHAGASTPNRQWPERNWHGLTGALRRDFVTVQIGSPSDLDVGAAIDLRGSISFRESAAVMSYCSAAVCTDSVFQHVAAALDVPAVVLFGSTAPSAYGHVGHRPIAVADLSCAPCYRPVVWAGDSHEDGSPWVCDHRSCMVDIHPDAVLRELRQLFSGARESASP